MEAWIAVIAAGIIAAFAYLEGRNSGMDKARKEGAEATQEMEEEIADAEMETELSKPISQRLRDLRERILQRRGDG